LDALENLQVLNLSFNRLVKVEGLGRLRLLQVVNVSNNSLRELGCLVRAPRLPPLYFCNTLVRCTASRCRNCKLLIWIT
jgi:Leucine-rich repeat (LRR) protein